MGGRGAGGRGGPHRTDGGYGVPDEEGPEALTQFLLLEVKKLREQLRNARLCERRLSKRCRAAEEERSRAEGKAHDHRYERLQLERWGAGTRGGGVFCVWVRALVHACAHWCVLRACLPSLMCACIGASVRARLCM